MECIEEWGGLDRRVGWVRRGMGWVEKVGWVNKM